MNRITIRQLETLAERINEATNSPKEYSTRVDGKFSANVGNYHISQAYGGVCLQRVCNTGGGVSTPLGGGHIPKRELYNEMQAFLRGIESAKG